MSGYLYRGSPARAPACWAVHPGIECSRVAPGGYCLPPRCYCGGCPWFLPISVRPTYTPDEYTAFDRKAIRTGHRSSRAEQRLRASGGRQS